MIEEVDAMKSPQQELYDYVFIQLMNRGYDTYDSFTDADGEC